MKFLLIHIHIAHISLVEYGERKSMNKHNFDSREKNLEMLERVESVMHSFAELDYISQFCTSVYYYQYEL